MLLTSWLRQLPGLMARRSGRGWKRKPVASRQGRRGVETRGSLIAAELLEDRVVLSAPSSGPDSFVVDTLTDVDDNNVSSGNLSLREAVRLANADSNASTITFASSLFTAADQSITLTNFDTGLASTEFGATAFIISTDIDIVGPTGNNGLTIERASGNSNNFRLFHVQAAGNLTLDSLTLSGGKAQGGNGTSGGGGAAGMGGAIFNQGALTVTNSTLSGNTAIGGGSASGFQGGGGGVGQSATSASSGGPNGGGLVLPVASAVVVAATLAALAASAAAPVSAALAEESVASEAVVVPAATLSVAAAASEGVRGRPAAAEAAVRGWVARSSTKVARSRSPTVRSAATRPPVAQEPTTARVWVVRSSLAMAT